MCRRLKANFYIFGTQGKDYAKVDDFAKEGIQIIFQDYRHPVYSQGPGPFLSHMSVVDLLFTVASGGFRVLWKGGSKSDVMNTHSKASE